MKAGEYKRNYITKKKSVKLSTCNAERRNGYFSDTVFRSH